MVAVAFGAGGGGELFAGVADGEADVEGAAQAGAGRAVELAAEGRVGGEGGVVGCPACYAW